MTIRQKVARAIAMFTPHEHTTRQYEDMAASAINTFLKAAAEPDKREVSWHMQSAGKDNRRAREEAALKFEWDE